MAWPADGYLLTRPRWDRILNTKFTNRTAMAHVRLLTLKPYYVLKMELDHTTILWFMTDSKESVLAVNESVAVKNL